MFNRFCRITAVGLASAAFLVQSAYAGGEPKNEWPFTRPADRSTQSASPQIATPPIQGEPKNEAPFTRPVTIVVSTSGSGFDWGDGAIGGITGIGISLAGAGAFVLARKSPRLA